MPLHQYEGGAALWLARAELGRPCPRRSASRPRGVRAELGAIWGGCVGFSDINVGLYTRIELRAILGGEARGNGGGWRRRRRYRRCCSSASSWSPSVPRLHRRSSGRVPCAPVETHSWTLHGCMQQPRNCTTHGAFWQSRISAPNATAPPALLLFCSSFLLFSRPYAQLEGQCKSHRNSKSHSSSQKRKKGGGASERIGKPQPVPTLIIPEAER